MIKSTNALRLGCCKKWMALERAASENGVFFERGGLESVPSRGWFLKKSNDFFSSSTNALIDATVTKSCEIAPLG